MVVKSLRNFRFFFYKDILTPSPLARASYLWPFFLVACTSFTIPTKTNKKNILTFAPHQEMETVDYADHFISLKASFLSTSGVRVVTISKSTEKYLNSLMLDLINKNEIFFKELKGGKVTILDVGAPLHFSLPFGEIFLSKGLVAKYIKHESVLAGILAYELVRSEKMLYPRETFVPVGYIGLERMVVFNRLSLEEKMEVHKWAHHIIVRSGYDGEYYLSWLQMQNRNTADFILQVGDANQITREESLFKAFLIKNSTEDNYPSNKNSSKNFYSFINSIRDGVL